MPRLHLSMRRLLLTTLLLIVSSETQRGRGGHNRVRSGQRRDHRRRAGIQRYSVCGRARRRIALATAASRCAVDATAAGDGVRRRVSAAAAAGSRRRGRIDRRGLPVSERVDRGARRQTSGHGVDSRRRVSIGFGLDADLRRHAVRAARCRARDAELSARPFRLLCAPGARRRESRRRARQLRLDGSGRGARMGQNEYRGVRRRSGQRHGVRRIGRRVRGAASADVAARARVCSRRRSSRAAAAIRSIGGSMPRAASASR